MNYKKCIGVKLTLETNIPSPHACLQLQEEDPSQQSEPDLSNPNLDNIKIHLNLGSLASEFHVNNGIGMIH